MPKSTVAYTIVGTIFLALSIYCLYLYLTEDTCNDVYSILMYVCIGLTLITLLYYFFGPDPEECSCAEKLGNIGKHFGNQFRKDTYIQANYSGAGILPIAHNPTDQKFYVLLGLEDFNNRGQKDRGWTDFGGKKDDDDGGMLVTAVREFSEETCHIFDNNLEILNHDQPIFVAFEQQNPNVIEYGLYAAKVKFQDASKLNRQLLSYRLQHQYLDHSYKEKHELTWVEMSTFVNGMKMLLQPYNPKKQFTIDSTYFNERKRVIARFVGGARNFASDSSQQEIFFTFLEEFQT